MKISESDILKMSRDQLIEFLFKAWTIMKFKSFEDAKEFFDSDPGFHTTDIMRKFAIKLNEDPLFQ